MIGRIARPIRPTRRTRLQQQRGDISIIRLREKERTLSKCVILHGQGKK